MRILASSLRRKTEETLQERRNAPAETTLFCFFFFFFYIRAQLQSLLRGERERERDSSSVETTETPVYRTREYVSSTEITFLVTRNFPEDKVSNPWGGKKRSFLSPRLLFPLPFILSPRGSCCSLLLLYFFFRFFPPCFRIVFSRIRFISLYSSTPSVSLSLSLFPLQVCFLSLF